MVFSFICVIKEKLKMKKDLYVAKSSIHGNGVFTKKNFKKGETVFILKGEKVFFPIRSKKDSEKGPNWVGIGRNLWIQVKKGDIVNYVNHSCNPNIGIKGAVTFVALKDIKKGEEITFDYSTTEEDIWWEIKNYENKNIKNYRPVIKSIQSLPLNVYKKYLPYIPKYFQKVYEKHNGLKKKNDFSKNKIK